eukprot:scaffold260639_cov36-Tisochrysis_lutea.AAC.4
MAAPIKARAPPSGRRARLKPVSKGPRRGGLPDFLFLADVRRAMRAGRMYTIVEPKIAPPRAVTRPRSFMTQLSAQRTGAIVRKARLQSTRNRPGRFGHSRKAVDKEQEDDGANAMRAFLRGVKAQHA